MSERIIERAIILMNDYINKRKASYEASTTLASATLLVERIEPVLERIAVALETRDPVSKIGDPLPQTATTSTATTSTPAPVKDSSPSIEDLRKLLREREEEIDALKRRLRVYGAPV